MSEIIVSETTAPAAPPPVGKSAEVRKKFRKIVQDHLIPVLEEAINEQRTFVQRIESLVTKACQRINEAEQASDKNEFLQAYTDYNQAVFDLILHRYEDMTGKRFDDIFAQYDKQTDKYLSILPLHHTEVQKEERFVTQPGDPRRVKFVKFRKRRQRTLRKVPVSTRNFLRKLSKKDPHPHSVWTYRVPLQRLVERFYQVEWINGIIPIIEKIYQHIALSTQKIWELEDRVYTVIYTYLMDNYAESDRWLEEAPKLPQEEYESIISILYAEMDALQEQVIADAQAQLTQLEEQFEQAYDRVGTSEVSARPYESGTLQKDKALAEKDFLHCTQGWRYTLYALHEDWRIDQELNLICTRLFNEHGQLKETLRKKIEESAIPQIDRLLECLNEIQTAIKEHPEERLRYALKQQQSKLDMQLIRTIIPTTIAVLYRQSLPAIVTDLRQATQKAVENISDKRGLVDTNVYDHPIRKSEITYISPRQIVNFESWPVLLAATEQAKDTIGQEVLDIQKLISEIGQVSYFNLDSAVSVYESEEPDPEKARSIAIEGLQRANKNAVKIKEKLTGIYRQADESLWHTIQEFNRNLVSLKQNDYALEIKLRIAKAKAVERTRTLKNQTVDYVKNAVPYALRYTQGRYRAASETVATYRKRMGIGAVATEVSTEVSDFLNDTETAINRLPYVYQRLFGNKPLDENVFYEDRPHEIVRLQEGYRNWVKGRYASAVLIGEKGGGATTLINFFLKKLSQVERQRYKILRADSPDQIYTEEDLLVFFQKLLPSNSFEKISEVTSYFNEHPQKHIIVWENLQHFYLRKVGGFVCLKLLVELISRTNLQVFWLCTCTRYAWDYLDKARQLSDYFEYVVPLEPINTEQLREAILKRHRVSGYSIKYAAPAEILARKKFQKLSDEDKQVYLENEYFNDLNRLTAGNFSIAQLYWLRSTQQVINDTITIGSLKTMDFSFTKAIPLSQMLILHALLLHDGLTEAQFQEMSERKTGRLTATHLGLMQLRDDGLVVKRDQMYTINPLLYRQIVQLLQTKNFLH